MEQQESISIFEIIKIGIGPSSSHTMGPWRASLFFLEYLQENGWFNQIQEIKITLYGSLAKTGLGHGTDIAAILGLRGEHYRVCDTDRVEEYFKEIKENKRIRSKLYDSADEVSYTFDYERDLVFDFTTKELPHPNTMLFLAVLKNGDVISRHYYSIGGGFVMTDESTDVARNPSVAPYPCHKAEDVIRYCEELNLSFPELIRLNERTWHTDEEVRSQGLEMCEEMLDSVWRGMNKEGVLPGGLGVKRRAHTVFKTLLKGQEPNSIMEMISYLSSRQDIGFKEVNRWVSCWACAVNEENANFGRIVTSPTNGASGVIPAVLLYALCFEGGISEEQIIDFILVAGEVGLLFKKGATISAAMGGCQAEIGVSSAMAAAALTAVTGGSTDQILKAAEIAMEHHLGLTCDPIKGLVQIPCIERNALGAVKAITASQLALERDPSESIVSLDDIILSMKETAANMNDRYKETAEGGMAISVKIPEC